MLNVCSLQIYWTRAVIWVSKMHGIKAPFNRINVTTTNLILSVDPLFLSPLFLAECKIENCEACFNRNFCTKCKEGLYSHRGRCHVSCPPGLSTVNGTMECVGEWPLTSYCSPQTTEITEPLTATFDGSFILLKSTQFKETASVISSSQVWAAYWPTAQLTQPLLRLTFHLRSQLCSACQKIAAWLGTKEVNT